MKMYSRAYLCEKHKDYKPEGCFSCSAGNLSKDEASSRICSMFRCDDTPVRQISIQLDAQEKQEYAPTA